MKKFFIPLVLIIFCLSACEKSEATLSFEQKLTHKWMFNKLIAKAIPATGPATLQTIDLPATAYMEFKATGQIEGYDGQSAFINTWTKIDEDSFKFEDIDAQIYHVTRIDEHHLVFYYEEEDGGDKYIYTYTFSR